MNTYANGQFWNDRGLKLSARDQNSPMFNFAQAGLIIFH